MAVRPIFVPSPTGSTLVRTHMIDFQWYPGMALSQAQKSVDSLHQEGRRALNVDRILEISSKSREALGVKLSAFNLMIRTVRYNREFSLECAYQASKVFERGGPFTDLLDRKSIEAKRDPRLNQFGRLIKFRFFGSEWDLEPRTAFYDWLYLNALYKQPELAEEVITYRAFSDIAFNPERSINCQAYAAALYVSLHERGLLTPSLLKDKAAYLDVIKSAKVSNAHEDELSQDRWKF